MRGRTFGAPAVCFWRAFGRFWCTRASLSTRSGSILARFSSDFRSISGLLGCSDEKGSTLTKHWPCAAKSRVGRPRNDSEITRKSIRKRLHRRRACFRPFCLDLASTWGRVGIALRLLALFLLPFGSVFGNLWSKGTPQDAPNVPKIAPSAPTVLQVTPGASKIIDFARFGCSQAFISSTFLISK